MKGIKYDSEKLRWDLLPFEEIEQIVDVLTFGSKKYTDDNWKKVPNQKKRYFSAMMRHISAWKKGEILDKETNINHLAHAGCCLLFLLWGDRKKNEV